MNHPESSYHYDENFQDYVWDRIFYQLVTMDISMEREFDPIVYTPRMLILPPPTKESFIPFSKVDDIIVLSWIDRIETDMVTAQKWNTIKLMTEYQQ